jgi:hypothetical protein
MRKPTRLEKATNQLNWYRRIMIIISLTGCLYANGQITTGYFNGYIWNTYSTVDAGALNGNNFTVSYTTSPTIRLLSNWTPGFLPLNTGYPASSPRMLELNSVGNGGTNNITFTNNLQPYTSLFIQDIDESESIKIEFLDASGVVQTISPSTIIQRNVSTTNLPTVAYSSNYITVSQGPVGNYNEPLVSFVIKLSTIRTVRVTENNIPLDQTYEIYFGLGYDHGDAPATYGDVIHWPTAGVYLGANVPDTDNPAAYSANATGDNQVSGGNIINDEDGVTIASVQPQATVNIPVMVNMTGISTAYLTAFFDWNRNGTFDAGEALAEQSYTSGGAKTLSVTVPVNATPGLSFARFRVSSTSGLAATGTAADGEVEDYSFCILPLAPSLSSVAQPTCSVATGSFTITNYDASFTYAVNPSTGVTVSGNTITAPAGAYTVTATAEGGCTSSPSTTITVNAQPLSPVQPLFSAIIQPTCAVSTGSFSIVNYDAANTYTFTPSAGVVNTAGTVTAPAGTYTVTATLGACTSVASASVTVNAQPATPTQPLLSAVTQPTCSTVLGSFTITNYDAANTYTFSPAEGVVNTAGSVVAPAGTYTVTATLGACTSVASASVTVNAQPATPAQPLLGAVTQPTCSVATGSFMIDNYDASFAYTVTPSAGVTISSNTITAPVGTYQVTATLGSCTSDASSNVIIYAQPTTPTATINSVDPLCANSTPVQLTGSPVGGIFSGTGVNIAGLFSPTVAGVGNHAVTYTYTNQYGCSAVATTSVQVTPAPSLSIAPATQSICSGGQAAVTASGDNGGIVTWTSNYFGLSGTGTTFNTGTLFNKGTSPLILTLNATVTAGSCADNTNATVTVLPEPRVTVVPGSAVVCFYEIPHFTLRSILSGTTINWQLINNADSSIVSSGTGSDNITLFSAPVPAGSYTLKVTGTKDGCSSAVVNVPLTVN